ncbi:MAG: site-specific DNA-methyltransferase [Betaproteobacteria bacterium]|nr:site-specific DNA-methyltransferase [Betaproteobacteria bacterium]
MAQITLLEDFLPFDPLAYGNQQTALPAIAKQSKLVKQIEDAVGRLPTSHTLYNVDARRFDFLEPRSVHLVVTSPPYWTLKEYKRTEGQLGYVGDYEQFLRELDSVWRHCYDALVPGGRLVCVVGDVCLSRRKNAGEHTVVPLHASIQEHCRQIGYRNLAPIIWYKIANAAYEAQGNGGGFLGKPYEPNAVIKNDIEFILMERKPGGYRSPSLATRVLSVISGDKHKLWFQQIWTGLTGASTRDHPAPYPLELAERLIRMFSFVGDTVLDPFMGTGTTNVAAAKWGRNSIGVELTPEYFDMAARRLSNETTGLFSETSINLVRGEDGQLRGADSNRLTASDSALPAYENKADRRATGRSGKRPGAKGRGNRRKAA